MRFVHYFSESQAVRDLLSEFDLSQGHLHHYTDQQAAAGIKAGEIWITRADCFLDQTEIQHGSEIIGDVARQILGDQESLEFHRLLAAIRERLKQCYVFSLSLDRDSPDLKSRYSGSGGGVVTFSEDFPQRLGTLGWHAVPIGSDSFRLHYFTDLYDFFEGSIIYDIDRKRHTAQLICRAFQEVITSQSHVVDQVHFVNILMKCCVLFKEEKFEAEKEYRIALVNRRTNGESFECARTKEGRQIQYIVARWPQR